MYSITYKECRGHFLITYSSFVFSQCNNRHQTTDLLTSVPRHNITFHIQTNLSHVQCTALLTYFTLFVFRYSFIHSMKKTEVSHGVCHKSETPLIEHKHSIIFILRYIIFIIINFIGPCIVKKFLEKANLNALSRFDSDALLPNFHFYELCTFI